MSTWDAVELRFFRSQEHLATLDSQISTFLKADGYQIRVHPNLRGQTYRCSVFGHRAKPVAAAWPLIVGEFLYNIRSCLDYVAGIFGGRTFPIDLTCQDYFAMNNRGMFVGGHRNTLAMAGPIQAAIAALQPYNVSPADPKSDALWMLESLRNTDVHGHLQVVAGAITDPAWRVFPADAISDARISFPDITADNRTELVRFKGRMDAKYDPIDVKVEFNTTAHIVFGPGQIGEGRDVVQLLENISVRVAEAVAVLRGVTVALASPAHNRPS